MRAQVPSVSWNQKKAIAAVAATNTVLMAVTGRDATPDPFAMDGAGLPATLTETVIRCPREQWSPTSQAYLNTLHVTSGQSGASCARLGMRE